MNKFNFIFKKSFWKNVLAVLLVVVLAAGFIAGGVALGKYIKDKKTTVTTIWERGAIAADGRVDSNNNSIHTKELFECRGLEIEPKLDANVKYRVAFYDSNKDFIEMTDYRSSKMKAEEVPFFAQYARVEVNAGVEDGTKVEIGLLKITSYSKQVKIRVDKKQSTLAARVQEITLTGNVASIDGVGYVGAQTGEYVYSSASPYVISALIDVSDANFAIVKVKTSSLTSKVRANSYVLPAICGYKVQDGAVIGNYLNTSYITCSSIDDCTYICYNVSDCEEFSLAVEEASSEVLEVYLFN